MNGHKDIRGVDYHGYGREEDGVEDGLFPRFKDVDACDEEVLVVEPGKVLPEVLEVHCASWTQQPPWGPLDLCDDEERTRTS